MAHLPSLKPIFHGPQHNPIIYLTFDDGPDPCFTSDLLDLLSHYEIKSSFFLLGLATEQHPDLTRRIADAGHSLGCHGFTHIDPWRCNQERNRDNIERGWRSVAKTSGQFIQLFRPPYGHWRYSMAAQARRLNMTTILWSLSAHDWGESCSVHSISKRLNKVRNGDIILMHDGARGINKVNATLRALPAFIESCKQRGYRFSPLQPLVNPILTYQQCS